MGRYLCAWKWSASANRATPDDMVAAIRADLHGDRFLDTDHPFVLNRVVPSPGDLGFAAQPFALDVLLGAWERLRPVVERTLLRPPFVDLYQTVDGRGLWLDYGIAACIPEAHKRALIAALGQLHDDLGLTLYDVDRSELVQPCRPKRFALTIDGGGQICEPTLEQVTSAIERLRPDREPTFLVLDHGSGNYFQIAASAEGLTVEARAYARYPRDYRHVLAVDGAREVLGVGMAIERAREFWTADGQVAGRGWRAIVV